MTSVPPIPAPPSASITHPPPPPSVPPAPLTQKPPQPNGQSHGTSAVARNLPINGRHINKKKAPEPPDPVTMYESVRSRIAALEEEEEHGEEEDRQNAEEARSSVRGMSDSAIHTKYVDLFQDKRRAEREHAKEKQKLTKDKDAARSQLTKANQSKNKLESLARELQKDNKKLRDDYKRLTTNFEDAQDVIESMKSDLERRVDHVRYGRDKAASLVSGKPKSIAIPPSSSSSSAPSESPADIIVKVVCKYRAELFFKVSRTTKLSKLFVAWTERMDTSGGVGGAGEKPKPAAGNGMTFLFSHHGRPLSPDRTADAYAIEDNDEILAVEMMDLTTDDVEEVPPDHRERLQKHWTDDPYEAKRAMEDIFDGVVRDRLKDVLRQYELREKHFDSVLRSKELEVLLARARAEEQKQLALADRQTASTAESQNAQLKQQMEEMQASQARLMDKLIACCKEPTGERTQRLFAFLREELQKRGSTKLLDDPDSGGIGG